MSKIVIIGGSGLIGSELSELAKKSHRKIISTHFSKPLKESIFFSLKNPTFDDLDLKSDDVIVLLAAISDQKYVSSNPNLSEITNVVDTKRLIVYAASKGCFSIFLSSEAVFGGNTEIGWYEKDQVSPLTAYGQQKVEVEDFILKNGYGAIIRTGWTISDNLNYRCPIVNLYQVMRDNCAYLSYDSLITLTSAQDVAKFILRIAEERIEGIFHAVSGSSLSYYDLGLLIVGSSKRANTMRYIKVAFEELMIKKFRVERSWLYTSGTHDIIFDSPKKIVGRKIMLLEKLIYKSKTI